MAGFHAPELKQKLFLLRQQNQKLLWFSIWRCLIISSLVGGLWITVSSSYWKIREPSQVKIEGDRLIGESLIHSLLKLNYPQFIWAIPSQQLSQKLKSIPPISDAVVTKQMFPPHITVTVSERIPVATALSQKEIGFLDAEGIWLNANYYHSGNENFTLPQLKVINFQTQYRETWEQIYHLVAMYPEIKLEEARWDEAANLYLTTNIGKVYLGSDRSLLGEQFQVLARFPNLSEQSNLTEVAYLDLSNPKMPFIQKHSRAN